MWITTKSCESLHQKTTTTDGECWIYLVLTVTIVNQKIYKLWQYKSDIHYSREKIFSILRNKVDIAKLGAYVYKCLNFFLLYFIWVLFEHIYYLNFKFLQITSVSKRIYSVKYLPTKCETLTWNSSTTHTEKEYAVSE